MTRPNFPKEANIHQTPKFTSPCLPPPIGASHSFLLCKPEWSSLLQPKERRCNTSFIKTHKLYHHFHSPNSQSHSPLPASFLSHHSSLSHSSQSPLHIADSEEIVRKGTVRTIENTASSCTLLLRNTSIMGKSIAVAIVFTFVIVAVVAQTNISVTLLHSAVKKGAVCLDGSPPGYNYVEGSGSGSQSWMIYLEGGAWCWYLDDCKNRSQTRLGSSNHFRPSTTFSGLLDLNSSFNPNFYNWHKVFIQYCDGASFMADVEHPVNGLMFRGARIYKVMIEEMMSKGMRNATNALLTGSSAGGLATSLHCDSFGALFPSTARVKCISDSGFFLHAEELPGAFNRTYFWDHLIALHELNMSLPSSCTKKMSPNLCLYPENFVGGIKTPLFLLESSFDQVQVKYDFVPYVGGNQSWKDCTHNLTCNSTELRILRDIRSVFIKTLLELNHSSSRGMFVHSFFRHGHLLVRNGWTCSAAYGNNVIANKTIGQAISDWYFDRISFSMIDAEHDIPQNLVTEYSDADSNFYNQECLATILSESIACHCYFVDIVYILILMFIALVLVIT